MTRTRSYLLTTTALASIVGAAVPAFAQAPAPAQMYAPAPMYAPPPAPAPMVAPAPMQEPLPVMPVAPVMAPRAADDMTGSLGLGFGVVAGDSVVKPDTADLLMKYWMSDTMAIMPRLQLTMDKTKGNDATWVIAPQAMALFVPWKTTSTRLDIGAGLGLAFAKTVSGQADTAIDIFVPVHLGVEHFFTRWFSMGIAIETRLIDYAKMGDAWQMHLGVQTSGGYAAASSAAVPTGTSPTTALASLMFYTD